MSEWIVSSATETTAELIEAGVDTILIKLLLGCVIGFLSSLAYIYSNRRSCSKHFAMMLVVLPALVSVVIVMVGSSVARAFSLAGIFALVKFRSIPGDSKDIMMVFFSMTIGLTVGLGCYPEAAAVTLVVGLLILAISLSPLGASPKEHRQLRITIPENLNFEHVFDDIFEAHFEKTELIQVKSTNMGTLFELTYHVTLKKEMAPKEMMDAIRTRNGNLNIVYGLIPEAKVNTTVL